MDQINEKFSLFLKRMFDILISILLLVILAFPIIIISIVIKITMPGPVFFRQRRVGKDGSLFKIIKFRTMLVDKEMERRGEKYRVDSANDHKRTTPVGRVLRRFKVDEIPQLFNVLRGDMSLVGPRPTFQRQTLEYTTHQRRRLLMKPGMTGLAQVQGGTSITWEERINYDVDYVNNYSIWLDIQILTKTVLIVLLGEKRFKKDYKISNSKSHISIF